ncbi:MAG: Asp-tRNA(Asn)/Glu-tRNA(Gln) amidotransferase subunit GatC [Syntrophobacteraceae bacterium]|jgi:aspartyl-tRNA(Asn)/glutamyl-tRNA(Gln) amidotransferase subunit C|nr:Asp-tRNA(Asn)/Glu-tRNA(Gln) amidotransferase subunit GatC [Syntrophobacteraceae bacterium]
MPGKITREEVRHVAQLARLDLSEADEALMTEQMNSILEYVDALGQVDTSHVAPTTHAIQNRNVLRPDRVLGSLHREAALANAPETDQSSFIVPKII